MNKKEKAAAVVSGLAAVFYAMLGFCMANPIYVTPEPEETDHHEVTAAMSQRWHIIAYISCVVVIAGMVFLVRKVKRSEQGSRGPFGVIFNLIIILLLAVGAVICGFHWIGYVVYGLALFGGVMIFVQGMHRGNS